jgi:hypothetical protein
MNENGKLPDYAEIWVNAHRARDVYLALSLALIRAAFTQGWKSPQQQDSSDNELPLPLGEAVEPADAERPMPSKRPMLSKKPKLSKEQRPVEKAPFDEERV